MCCVQDKSCQRELSSSRLWSCNSKICTAPCWLVIYHSDWPNWWHIVKSLGFSPALPGDTPPFSTHALNKRSGIDRGLGVLINLTSIYKAIGWITRDASLHKLTNRPPDQKKVHTARQVQSRPGEEAERRGAKRVPRLPSRGFLWKRHDPRTCLCKQLLAKRCTNSRYLTLPFIFVCCFTLKIRIPGV